MKAIIVAYSDNRVIGNHGEIPWLGKVPADMKHLRELTTNQAIIMGRTTFESIGRPLPKRQNIVLTSSPDVKIDNVSVANNLSAGLALVEPGRDGFIFGGAQVYAESLRRAKELGITTIFATEIHEEFLGDAFFPKVDSEIWEEAERIDYSADKENLYPYSFVRYERA